jgi:methionine synthase II (cobalamin-independent)
MSDFKPKCGCSGIGSIPHKKYEKVIDNIVKNYDFPYWPQVCNRGFIESMYVQFSEGMPSLNVDFEKNHLFFDTKNDKGLYEWYEKFIANDLEHFKISKDYAYGFYDFLERAKGSEYVKGQIVGPISFGLAVFDQDKKPILYDQQFFEAVFSSLAMTAIWQVKKLKEISKNVIMFFDEPSLCSYGSAFTALEKDVVIKSLNYVINSAKQEGAIVGVHCCGNTDWSLLMSTDTDIISFDAYNFSDRLALYPNDVKKFLERGSLAWGIVPTSEDIIKENTKSLVNKLEQKIEDFTKEGIDKSLILEKMMITPSCGVGSLEKKHADKVLKTTLNVSKKMKKKYFS